MSFKKGDLVIAIKNPKRVFAANTFEPIFAYQCGEIYDIRNVFGTSEIVIYSEKHKTSFFVNPSNFKDYREYKIDLILN